MVSKNGNSKRKKRLVSRLFRDQLGISLRTARINQSYSLGDISHMTTIAINTISKIEKGDATNIDYYVEYAKAVGFDFGNLKEFGIPLVPIVPLSKERKEATQLTAKIRSNIINKNFLNGGKTIAEIRNELIHLKQIDPKKVTSTDIAGVFRNLLKDNQVKVINKDGRKNLYEKC